MTNDEIVTPSSRFAFNDISLEEIELVPPEFDYNYNPSPPRQRPASVYTTNPPNAYEHNRIQPEVNFLSYNFLLVVYQQLFI